MAKYAVIENNKVVNFIEAEHENVLPNITLIKADENTSYGDIWNGETFKKPPIAPLTAEDEILLKQELITEIDNELNELDQKSIRAIGEINDTNLSDEARAVAQSMLQENNQEKEVLRKTRGEIIQEIKNLDTGS